MAQIGRKIRRVVILYNELTTFRKELVVHGNNRKKYRQTNLKPSGEDPDPVIFVLPVFNANFY